MSQMFCFLCVVLLVIAALIFAMICLTNKGSKHLDVEQYRVKYLEIENSLKRDEVSSYHLAVLNADKLVKTVIKQKLKSILIKDTK